MLLIGQRIQCEKSLSYEKEILSKPWDILTISAVCVEDRNGPHFGDIHFAFENIETKDGKIPMFKATNEFITTRELTEQEIIDYENN